MKKLVELMAIVAMIAALAACGNSASKADALMSENIALSKKLMDNPFDSATQNRLAEIGQEMAGLNLSPAEAQALAEKYGQDLSGMMGDAFGSIAAGMAGLNPSTANSSLLGQNNSSSTDALMAEGLALAIKLMSNPNDSAAVKRMAEIEQAIANLNLSPAEFEALQNKYAAEFNAATGY